MPEIAWDNFLGILILVIVFVIIALIIFTTFQLPDSTVNLKPLMCIRIKPLN